ncbi:four helix bundle protein [Lujinxingia vulgaris]|uniref:Four helix bundle protein n=1 Tax=Lujinxingia vulgaris TaxID=2600176 RepID=A0A5C6XHK5_9DELT|nr:four helix bundle protein [Lujinxingia vulgaris]TXD36985.1 four helix bundle protein [Lujinxingia vulgaris]
MQWFREDRQRPHHHLNAWRYGRDFALAVYKVTRHFPKEERYGLTSQLRRAAVSIPSNIAEGAARRTSNDFLRFLYNARGSLEEVDTQLEIASELDMLSPRDIELLRKTFDPLSRTLTGLIRSIQQKTDGRP